MKKMLGLFSKNRQHYRKYLDFIDSIKNTNLQHRHERIFHFDPQDEIDFCTSNGITFAAMYLISYNVFPSHDAITKACHSLHFDVIDEMAKIDPSFLRRLDQDCIDYCCWSDINFLELFLSHKIETFITGNAFKHLRIDIIATMNCYNCLVIPANRRPI